MWWLGAAVLHSLENFFLCRFLVALVALQGSLIEVDEPGLSQIGNGPSIDTEQLLVIELLHLVFAKDSATLIFAHLSTSRDLFNGADLCRHHYCIYKFDVNFVLLLKALRGLVKK